MMLGRSLGMLLDHLRDRRRRARWSPEQAAGRRGEDLAHRFLQKHGYVIVARNYRPAFGGAEADLIAWDGPELVLVEVKTRATTEFGPPDRAVGPEKQRAVRRAARDWARKAHIPRHQLRCDVVTVVLSPRPQIELFQNAFRWNF